MTMKNVSIIKPNAPLLSARTRVAVYARVSAKGELNEHSLNAQVDYYSKLIATNPRWENAGIFADYGLSGTGASRPGFQNLIALCDSGKVDLVLVKSISRFCRNTVDLLNTVRHLKEIGINVRFEKENIDSLSDNGELMLTLLASFAQEESRSISENVKWAYRKGFESGKVNHFILYGYKWNGTEFSIVPDQAQIVQEIYSRYLSGEGPCGISNDLRKRNIKSLNGKPFYESHVWRILREEKYTGNSLLQKCYRESFITKKKMTNQGELPMFYAEGTHPVIIEQKVYDAVQQEIKRREKLGFMANPNLNANPFTNLIVCSHCGRTYRRTQKPQKNGKKYYRWKCGSKMESRGEKCLSPNIAEDVLYQLTSEAINDEASNSTVSRKIKSITVSDPFKLTFHLADGQIVERQWKLRCSNADYQEKKYADNSKESHCNTSNAD